MTPYSETSFTSSIKSWLERPKLGFVPRISDELYFKKLYFRNWQLVTWKRQIRIRRKNNFHCQIMLTHSIQLPLPGRTESMFNKELNMKTSFHAAKESYPSLSGAKWAKRIDTLPEIYSSEPVSTSWRLLQDYTGSSLQMSADTASRIICMYVC